MSEHEHQLPPLPALVDDPQGVEAQDILRVWATDAGAAAVAMTPALLKWLRQGGSQLLYRSYTAGVTDQTRKDIENYRARMALYSEWLEVIEDLPPEQLEGNLWAHVLGPIVAGDFENVPDVSPGSPYKMPGIFDTTIDGQTEVAQLYRLSNAVGVEHEIWKENVVDFFKDVGKQAVKLAKLSKPGVIEAVETAETVVLVGAAGLGLYVLYRVLR